MNFDGQQIEMEFFHQLIRMLPGNVYWKDTQGRYLGCNESQAAAFQLSSAEEVVNTTDYDYFSKEDADGLFKNDQYVMASKELQTIEETGAFPGQKKATYLSKKIPLKNKHNEVIGILGVSFDITERKKTEAQIRHAKEEAENANQLNSRFLAQLVEEVTGQHVNEKQTSMQSAEEVRNYLENILAVMPGHVYWQDKNNIYLGCNDIQAKHSGLKSRKEIIGKKLSDLMPPEIAESVIAIDKQVIETSKPIITEEYGVMASGPGYYLSHKVPLRDKNNEVIGMLGVSFDISARKEAEEYLKKAKQHAEEASHTKSQFIANMSHDIRTPLSGLLGMAEMLEKRVKKSEEKELANHIVNSGKRLSRLLNEILEFAALDSNKQKSNLSVINIKSFLSELIESLSKEAKQKNNHLTLSCDEALPEFIMSDSMRIHRILLNLLYNALRFTENGKITVDVSAVIEPKPELIFVVKDTGVGMPADRMESIFEPFSKLDPSYSKNNSGVGLGLHIVKQFAQDLSGKITVESQPKQGSTFTLTIPLTLPAENELNKTKKEKTKKSSSKTSKALDILLIEDDYICQKAAELLLADLNHRVDVASSAGEALAKLEKKYDVIFMDIGLPDMGGMELAKKIRNEAGCNQNTFIAALTAHVSQDHKDEFLNAGMNAVLFKPFSSEDLDGILNHFF